MRTGGDDEVAGSRNKTLHELIARGLLKTALDAPTASVRGPPKPSGSRASDLVSAIPKLKL